MREDFRHVNFYDPDGKLCGSMAVNRGSPTSPWQVDMLRFARVLAQRRGLDVREIETRWAREVTSDLR